MCCSQEREKNEIKFCNIYIVSYAKTKQLILIFRPDVKH